MDSSLTGGGTTSRNFSGLINQNHYHGSNGNESGKREAECKYFTVLISFLHNGCLLHVSYMVSPATQCSYHAGHIISFSEIFQ